MGWVSLLEDTLERIQESILLAETSLQNEELHYEEHRIASLKALGDAKTILASAWEHLEIATSPELDLAHKIKKQEAEIKSLHEDVKIAESKTEKFEKESANHYAKLQDALHEISSLKEEKQRLEKIIEKISQENFASAVEAFSSPGMLKKHKPNT